MAQDVVGTQDLPPMPKMLSQVNQNLNLSVSQMPVMPSQGSRSKGRDSDPGSDSSDGDDLKRGVRGAVSFVGASTSHSSDPSVFKTAHQEVRPQEVLLLRLLQTTII